MIQRLKLNKEIHIETTKQKLWWYLINLSGLSKWLIEEGWHSNQAPELEVNNRFEYLYNNVVNRGIVVELTTYKLIRLRNQYSLSIINGNSINFPLVTTFSLEHHENLIGTLLRVEIKGFYGELGPMLKDIFDYSYSKVLLNLKSVIELGIDMRPLLFREMELGLYYQTVEVSDADSTIKGTVVTFIKKDSIGELAGIRVNDILLRINGEDVSDYMKLSIISNSLNREDRIKFHILRDGQKKVLIYNHGFFGGE